MQQADLEQPSIYRSHDVMTPMMMSYVLTNHALPKVLSLKVSSLSLSKAEGCFLTAQIQFSKKEKQQKSSSFTVRLREMSQS